MSSVRIEGVAFSDGRFERLAAEAGLGDADHALGKMARLWHQCTLEGSYELPAADVNHVLGERGVDALVAARLGERTEHGVRLCGTKGRIEWLEKLRRNGKKGGRPKKTKWKPSGFQESNPTATATATATALTEISDCAAGAAPGAPVPKSTRGKPKVSLPADWQPSAGARAKAASAGLDLDREVERFRNHAAQNDRKCASWDHAFGNWLLEAEDRKRRQPGLALVTNSAPFTPKSRLIGK